MAKALSQPPKGTRDFLPVEVRRRDFVTRIIRQVYEAHGFEPLETPSFERLETLLGKYGEEGDQLLFKVLLRGQPLVDGIRKAHEHLGTPGALIKGRSGEVAPGADRLLSDLGLRYDLTVPLARVYAEYQGKLPAVFKRYQIQPVWRADTPGKGRFREFYQCDVDVCGTKIRLAEAEVIGAVAECLRRLGFEKFDIRINHRQLLRVLLEHAGIPVEYEGPTIVAIDKLDKMGKEGVDEELERVLKEQVAKHGIPVAEGARTKLLDLVAGGIDLDAAYGVLGHSEAGRNAILDLRTVLDLCSATPAADHLRFNISLARGLGYYTGCIFEIVVPDLAGSLGGGGRYDGLIGMFLGREVPAVGFSIGLERILVLMEERGMFPASIGGVDLVLAAIDAEAQRDVLRLATELRRNGLKIDLLTKLEKPGLVRKYADERGAAYAAMIGKEHEGTALLWSRDEPDRTDRREPIDQIGRLVTRRVSIVW